MPNQSVGLLFALFALSGFTGLIYESVWSHYLKLFLGAAAFAQSFVLAAFMGGMALGAWLASRWSLRLKNLLAAYGWIEATIGVAALVFHELYLALTAWSLDHAIPALGSPGSVEIYKYALCGLLLIPQTILLGATFPLLSGAVIRREPEASGHHLATLYFSNSIGAAAGALAAAFLLLGWLGMPGTMRFAGVLNLALAAVVLAIARMGEPASPAPASPTAAARAAKLLLIGAFITGLASFVYEIVWIRMLSLVLGSSFQAFELMLSAFITGLALGGWWIRRRIDAIGDPYKYLGIVQVFMGLTALATVFVYHWTFDWMAWGLAALQRNESAYPVFNLFSHALAFAVMLPPTFLAGMTLPLITHALIRKGRDERAIGQVYAFNTLGAIAGVLLTIHLLLPGAGLRLTLILGAAADLLLGAWFLRHSQTALRTAYAFSAVILGTLAATGTARAEILPPERLASGVFRYGKAVPEDRRVFFYQDGKTASVAIRASSEGAVSILTNGKPDAAVQMDPGRPPESDEYTMSLLGALPLLIKPDAKVVANIGWGSGMTTEVLMSHSAPREMHAIEIEPAMVAGARSFAPRNNRAYRDPRVRVFFEDAKSFFARHGKRYDVIISEPSNPWVSGVASLFTTEFYRDSKRYLAPGGLFVQWLHTYELNDTLLASMIAALGENFSDYRVYAANSADLVVVATAEGRVPPAGPLPRGEPAFVKMLARLGIRRIEDIEARGLGSKREIGRLFDSLGAPVNSDFRPFVQLEAPRARFESTFARAIFNLATSPLPILEMVGSTPASFLRDPRPDFDQSPPIIVQSMALELERGLSSAQADPLRVANDSVRTALLTLKRRGALCHPQPTKDAVDKLQWVAEVSLAHLEPKLTRALWSHPAWLGCPSAGLSQHLRDRFAVYAAIASRDAPAMLERSRALLAQPATGGDSWGRFLLSTAMLGGHASGQHEEADRLWNTYRGALYGDGQIPPGVVFIASLR